MADRCTGLCCRAFPLNASIDDIHASARADVAGRPRFTDASGLERGHFVDSVIVSDMVIPLGKHKAHPVTGKAFQCETELFTCKHLMSTGDCAIYYRRPRVCSEYPYRHEQCDHAACEWERIEEPAPLRSESLVVWKETAPTSIQEVG